MLWVHLRKEVPSVSENKKLGSSNPNGAEKHAAGGRPEDTAAKAEKPRKKRMPHDELDDNELLKRRMADRGGPRGPMMSRMIQEKPKDMKKTLRRLFSYLGSAKLLVIGLLVMTIFTTAASLAGAALQGIAIDSIRHQNPDGTYSFEWQRLVLSLVAKATIYVSS